MSRLSRARNSIVAALAVIAAASGSSVFAQSGHWDYSPGHFHRHGNHWDYHPGRYWHQEWYPQPVVPYQPTYPHTPHYPPATDYYPPAGSYPSQPGPHPNYVFGAYEHVDELAAALETQTNLLCWTLHRSYQRNPGFAQTYREAYEMRATAKYLHDLEHHHGNRDRIRQVAADLDNQFHHIEQDVAAWSEDNDFHGVRGQGRIVADLRRVEDTLHHLMTDIGMKGQRLEAPAQPAAGGPPPLPAEEPFGAP